MQTATSNTYEIDGRAYSDYESAMAALKADSADGIPVMALISLGQCFGVPMAQIKRDYFAPNV